MGACWLCGNSDSIIPRVRYKQEGNPPFLELCKHPKQCTNRLMRKRLEASAIRRFGKVLPDPETDRRTLSTGEME